MCYFVSSPLLSVEEHAIDDAIEAWKKVAVGSSGQIVSAFQGTFWRPENYMRARAKPSRTNRHGIYAFKAKTHAQSYHTGTAVVRVNLWGHIMEFGERRRRMGDMRFPGYRAQYAEIQEIILPNSLSPTAIRGIKGRWLGHGVRVTTRGGRVILSVDEPMPAEAA